jgi:hypothetical protein
MQCVIGLALDARIPVVNVPLPLPFRLSLAVMVHRTIVEVAKKPDLIVACTNDLAYAVTLSGLLAHHLLAHLRYQELWQLSRPKPLAR